MFLSPEEFSIANGLLTPTLKVKRREVERRFADVIDQMYARFSERRERGSEPDPRREAAPSAAGPAA